jgi:hypothetical protein
MPFFEYLGFTVHRLGLCRYFIIGPGFRGCSASVIEAVKIINVIAAGQCMGVT